MMNNGTNTIDDQIRAALEHFEQPYNAEHWHDMNAQLDALNAADASFDASLRERLADISVLPMAGAWSKMAEQLEELDAADSSFDAALRGRLSDVVVAPAMGDWSKMAAALDDFEDTDAEFDEVLRRKLENITANYPNHWAMMNERLDREFTLKGKIVRYKIVEAALMLLALFTVINAIDWNTAFELKIKNEELKTTTPNESDLKKDNGVLKTIIPTFKTTPQSKVNEVKSFDNSTNWRERGGIQYKNEQNNPQGVQNVQQNKNEQNNQQGVQNVQQNQQRNMTPTGQPIVDNSAKNVLFPDVFNVLNAINGSNVIARNEATEGGTLINNMLQNADVATVLTPNSSNNSVNSNQTLVEVVPSIDILQANLLNNNKLDGTLNFVKTANADKKGRWRLSTFGTAALDWVTTSFVSTDRKQYFQKQVVANYGVNALVGYKHGKVEIETGLMVNRKKYSIANAEFITGTVVSRNATTIDKPQDLRLSIVSIPLNLNVNVKNTRRLNVYAHTGVAVNAIVDALDRRELIGPVNPAPYGAPPPTDSEKADYSKGLLNGGETKENVFLTAHIGVGLEYKLTPKTSLFMQPTANFMVNKAYGIGTLNDKIITYSIQGGAKWRL